MKSSLSFAPLAVVLALAAPVAAQAHTVVYTATLSGPAESPANASPGIGSATLTVDDHDNTMRVQASFSGLIGTVSLAHIHCCTVDAGAGVAGVATPLPTFPGFPSGVTSGSYDQTFDLNLASSYNPSFVTLSGGTVANAYAALLTGLNAGKAYLNLHTSAFGGGEIRGFFVAAPVPEPGTYAMLLAGLGLVGLALRRRR